MARIGEMDSDDDGEIGRGRQSRGAESTSSSRESSPSNTKRRKRPLTPASDDDSVVIPEDPTASPPPSQVQPLIRQAVGFGSALGQSSADIPMYQATAPEQPLPADRYLPGQAIGLSTPSNAPVDNRREDRVREHDAAGDQQFRFSAYQPPATATGTVPSTSSKGKGKAKASTGRKKKRLDEQYAGQVDKFRVSYNMGYTLPSQAQRNYAGTTSPHPTTTTMDTRSARGSPAPTIIKDYSLYFDAPPGTHTLQVSGPSTSGQRSLTSSSSKSSTPAPSSSKGKGKAKAETKAASKASHGESSNSRSGKPSAGQTSTDSATHVSNSDASNFEHSNNFGYGNDQQRASSLNLHVASPISHPSHTSPRASSPIQQNTGYGRRQMSPSASGTGSASLRASTSSKEPMGSHRKSPKQQQQQPSASYPGAMRMVTLLIEDLRSGHRDPQIAEVQVHLRPHDDPEHGFWANAREISEQLQAGPSRIDGPARVFSLRGKYRQFFLRVSPDNQDLMASANLAVEKDRSLEVFVEDLPRNDGHVLPPPVVGRDPDTDEEMQSMSTTRSTGQPSPAIPPYIPPSSLPPKRRRGMSNSSYASTVQQQSPYTYTPTMSVMSPQYSGRSPSPTSYRSPPAGSPSKKSNASSYVQWDWSSSAYGQHPPPTHQQPASNGPDAASGSSSHQPPTRNEINDAIVAWVKPQIEEHSEWMAYMKSKAFPLTASVAISQYRFVQGRVEFFHGSTTPPDLPVAPKQRIGKPHVLKAMNLTTQWGAECSETLRLVDMYGPKGSRYPDSRVVDILQEDPKKGPLPPGSAPKRLLNLLREIHNDWITDHPEDAD